MGATRDVAVVGGGLVGTTLALALERAGARVALVEARALVAGGPPGYDDRPIALAEGSRRILDTLGLWAGLAPRAEPIRAIHVSHRGRPGLARIEAAEMGVRALGHVATARDIAAASIAPLDRGPALDVIAPAEVEQVAVGAEEASLEVRVGQPGRGELRSLRTRLVVAADGAGSALARRLGVRVSRRDYAQSALATNVTPERPHEGVAYERFTRSGPLALLPMTGGRCGVVWTLAPARAETLAEAAPDAFVEALAACFGGRLGAIVGVGERAVHPLALTRAETVVGPRLALLGNAANSLHPVAGQGLNLGLRDAAALADVVSRCLARGGDPGAPGPLAEYRAWRGPDQRMTALATDALARLFTGTFPPLAAARDVGLLGFDLAAPLKRAFARQAMGLAGRQSRLTRGLAP